MANLHMINISSLDFHIWQHLEKHWIESQLQHLASIPSVPVGQLYSCMTKGIQPITLFSLEESTGDTDSIWTLFSHTGVYVMAIGSLIPEGLGIFCCYFLVLTCQISIPTFTTRYHTIYNCGWWCRGSTHLQIGCHGLTAYKTSWESWPVYKVYTYTDRESIQCKGAKYVCLFIYISYSYASVYGQLRFSLYCGAVITRTQF